jgi:hypothetical protein
MSDQRGDIPCPSCGEPIRKKALRCSSCGTANPLQERTSFGERIGTGWTVVLLAGASVALLVLCVWLAYELLALGRLNPYVLAAGSLLLLVGIGQIIMRRTRP